MVEADTKLDLHGPDEGRRQKGLAIAAIARITKTKLGYKVPSQSGEGSYVVKPR